MRFTQYLLCLWLISCTVAPAKIEYGKDACHFCKMIIVDKTHASQVVAKTSKPYHYDSIECMLNDLKKSKKEKKIALFLVTDYTRPATLIDATKATYLISAKIKSPMGANLSAFSSKEDAERHVHTKDDKLFNWEDIQSRSFK